jgi:hypothetical protein
MTNLAATFESVGSATNSRPVESPLRSIDLDTPQFDLLSITGGDLTIQPDFSERLIVLDPKLHAARNQAVYARAESEETPQLDIAAGTSLLTFGGKEIILNSPEVTTVLNTLINNPTRRLSPDGIDYETIDLEIAPHLSRGSLKRHVAWLNEQAGQKWIFSQSLKNKPTYWISPSVAINIEQPPELEPRWPEGRLFNLESFSEPMLVLIEADPEEEVTLTLVAGDTNDDPELNLFDFHFERDEDTPIFPSKIVPAIVTAAIASNSEEVTPPIPSAVPEKRAPARPAEVPRALLLQRAVISWLAEQSEDEPGFDPRIDRKAVIIGIQHDTRMSDVDTPAAERHKPSKERLRRIDVLQRRLNPHLYDENGEIDTRKSGRTASTRELERIHGAFKSSEAWVGRAACKGTDAEEFHPIIPTKTAGEEGEAEFHGFMDRLLIHCQGCPVKPECETFGRQTIGLKTKGYNVILGGMIFGSDSKTRTRLRRMGYDDIIPKQREETPQDELVRQEIGDLDDIEEDTEEFEAEV